MSPMTAPAWRLAAAAMLLWTPVRATCQELHVDRGAHNTARFISHTQVDEFEGVTDGIDGYAILAGAPLDAPVYFEVDLASLDTGIGLRNRHMRDNYLETTRYPYASFKGRVVRAEQREGGGALHVTAAGEFSVHGVSRDREIDCDVVPSGSSYRTTCAFTVLLSDHDITIPKIMFLKLANEIRVEVELALSSSSVGEAS